jgi:hypothetical protein
LEKCCQLRQNLLNLNKFSDLLKVLASSFSQNYNSSFVIRNQMFLPFLFVTDQNNLNNFFKSSYWDVSPWIALDLGSNRTVSAIQISQDASRASSGNTCFLINNFYFIGGSSFLKAIWL